MAELEAFMRDSLHRSTCPDAMELGDYQMGLLTPEREQAVREHMRECRRCSEEAKALENFQKILALDLEIRMVERVKTWVASLLPGAGVANGLSPALGLRGDIGQVMTYQAGEAQLSLSVQEDPQNPDRRALIGLLIGAPADPDSVRINLFHGDRMSTLGLVDELGNFTIMGIKPGAYELTLRGRTFEIFVSPLRIE